MTPLADWLSLRRAAAPGVAVEMAANRVSAAAIEQRGDRLVVGGHAVEALPPGVLLPSLAAQNVRDAPAIVQALTRVLEQVGKPRRIGLVVPDPVAKISLLRFAQVPERRQDVDQLIRWQMRKTAPFPIEDAQLSYVKGVTAADGQDFVVSIARRDVIGEYEAVCAAAGAHAGVVDISTFNVVNGLLAGRAQPGGDWMLINVAIDYASIVILRGEHPIFFRSRSDSTEGSLADLVHQTTMYYEDRLQGTGFGRVVISGVAEAASQPADVDQVRRTLESRLRVEVEVADIRDVAILSDRIAAAPPLLDVLAPLVGLLARR